MDDNFTVMLLKKEVVAAALPLQEHWLPLSNLDLLLPPVDVSVFFCFMNHNNKNNNNFSNVLKKSLAEALVSYYAFAGEIVSNSVGEPELLCNNHGVEYFEAYGDVGLDQLNLYNPDLTVEGKLVPQKKHGVLSVQATQLKCGGFVVACSFDHRIADAYSGNMFLISWAEIARSKPITVIPSFRRSLLNPRHPLCIDHSIDQMYVPTLTLTPPKHEPTDDYLISRIYYIEADTLNEIQSLASFEGCNKKRSKLESFSAFLWKLVAKSVKQENNTKKCKMGIVVDGRTRLSEGENVENKAKLMSCYFGNVLSIPFGEHESTTLIERPLCWIANEVHDFLESSVTKDHFLGLIDWVEAQRPEPALAKIYSNGCDGGPAFVVSSGQRFSISKVDFGWGKPVFGSYHFPWGGQAGYVMPMPSTAVEGDWVVYMHMLKGQLEVIENEAANVFKPLTSDYLNLSH